MTDELSRRRALLRDEMLRAGGDAFHIYAKANLLYYTGRIFEGFCLLTEKGFYCFAKRESCAPDGSIPIRKYEDLPAILASLSEPLPKALMLETDRLPYSEAVRLAAALGCSLSGILPSPADSVRAVKSEYEIGQIRECCRLHTESYREIPSLYRQGDTDLSFQARVEAVIRQRGMTGYQRVKGATMECGGGMVLAGSNALTASPYDFGMGGSGVVSFPMGACGLLLSHGMTVSFDMTGCYNAYCCDLTRVFSLGEIPAEAYRLHAVSEKIHSFLLENARPGASCAELYDGALEIVAKEHAEKNFMAAVQKNSFIAHGIGLELNERPVICRRSRDVLREGNVFAAEPKLALDGVGPLGNEDTYLVTSTGCLRLTEDCPREIISLNI